MLCIGLCNTKAQIFDTLLWNLCPGFVKELQWYVLVVNTSILRCCIIFKRSSTFSLFVVAVIVRLMSSRLRFRSLSYVLPTNQTSVVPVIYCIHASPAWREDPASQRANSNNSCTRVLGVEQ